MVSLNEFIKSVADAFNTYFEAGGLNHIALLAVSMIVIVIFEKKRRIKEINVIIPVAIIVFVILNPVAYILFKKNEYSYYRTFWLVLIPFIIGTAVCVLMNAMEEKRRLVSLIIAIILIICTGPVIGMHTRLKPINNVYRLDSQVIEIANILMSDECKDKKAVVPDEIAWQIRQYRDIKLLYGRGGWVYRNGIDKSVYDMINGEIPFSTEKLISVVKANDFQFIVLKSEMADLELMSEYGFIKTASTKNYEIFKQKNSVADGYLQSMENNVQ